MPINTIYNPERVFDFQKSNVNFNGQSVFGEAIETEVKEIDLTLTEDHMLTGAHVIVKGAKIQDKITLQVVHPQAGVVNQFVTQYRCVESSDSQIVLDLSYPAKLAAGLKIRIKFEASNDLSLRQIAVNYFLHRILI